MEITKKISQFYGIPNPIGEKIKIIIALEGLTQTAFMEKSGFSNKKLSQYLKKLEEDPESSPPFELIIALRTALGVDINSLIDGREPEQLHQPSDNSKLNGLLLKLIQEQQKNNQLIMSSMSEI
jgi:transcriptional regulator with XRE-family HTH domain